MINQMRLVKGETYRVIEPFVDDSGTAHAVGERWHVRSSEFVPYDDTHWIEILNEAGAEQRIPLCVAANAQRNVVDNPSLYLKPEGTRGRAAWGLMRFTDTIVSWCRTLSRICGGRCSGVRKQPPSD